MTYDPKYEDLVFRAQIKECTSLLIKSINNYIIDVGCAHSSCHHSNDIPYNVYHVYQDLKKVLYIEFQCQNIYQGTQAFVMIMAISYGQKRLSLDMTTKNAVTPSILLQMTQNFVCSIVGS